MEENFSSTKNQMPIKQQHAYRTPIILRNKRKALHPIIIKTEQRKNIKRYHELECHWGDIENIQKNRKYNLVNAVNCI